MNMLPQRGEILLQSEKIRGEPRFYWVEVFDGNKWRSTLSDGSYDKRKMLRLKNRLEKAKLDGKLFDHVEKHGKPWI